MKNKAVTYLLIGVVLLIWGLVFYRIFNATQEQEAVMPRISYRTGKKENVNQAPDTFDLIADYRDPFLDKPAYTHSEITASPPSVNKKASERKTAKAPEPPIDWSFISFKGAIRNNQAKKEIGMFRINNTDAMLSANEKAGEITVLKVSRDSASVLYKGVKKSLFKEF